MIEIDGSQFNDFKQFLKQDNLQWFTSISPNGDWYLVTVPTTEQTFKLDITLFKRLAEYDPIIFGKDSTENVVNIDVKDDGQVILYKEVNGKLESETREFHPWMLTNP